jgi:plasmid maintenance system antidote protein VapI
MKKKRGKGKSVSESIRAAVKESGLTLYRIAKDAGIAYPNIHRFMNGQTGLSVENVDRLCKYLGLRLVKDN